MNWSRFRLEIAGMMLLLGGLGWLLTVAGSDWKGFAVASVAFSLGDLCAKIRRRLKKARRAEQRERQT